MNTLYKLMPFVMVVFFIMNQVVQIQPYDSYVSQDDDPSISEVDYELDDTSHLSLPTAVPDNKNYVMDTLFPLIQIIQFKSVLLNHRLAHFKCFTESDGFVNIMETQSNYLL